MVEYLELNILDRIQWALETTDGLWAKWQDEKWGFKKITYW